MTQSDLYDLLEDLRWTDRITVKKQMELVGFSQLNDRCNLRHNKSSLAATKRTLIYLRSRGCVIDFVEYADFRIC